MSQINRYCPKWKFSKYQDRELWIRNCRQHNIVILNNSNKIFLETDRRIIPSNKGAECNLKAPF